MFFDLNTKINQQKPFAQKEIVKSSIEGDIASNIKTDYLDGYSGVAFNFEYTGSLGNQHV